MLELPRDSQEIGEVEMPDPQCVDARHGGDGLHVGEALARLDLRNHHGPGVQRRDLRRDVAALVVVVAKPNAAPRRPSGG